MPEGDTVFRAARRLDEVLAGATVTRFDLRVPRLAVADLTGAQIHDVVARGKHILHRIGDDTLRTHLKMEGRWHIQRPGDRWPRPAHTARVLIDATAPDGTRWETVGFDLADVALVPTADEQQLIGHLGPDPLGDTWDPDEAARRVRADDRPVHVALLDQRNVAGFGNEYANEILFVRGIHPAASTRDVDTAALIEVGARMMRANRDRAHRTFTGDARRGFTTWVYRRENRPCRRCGTAIRGGIMGADPTRERIVFWCPRCQSPS